MSDDQLVADYLRRLRTAAGGLPADRRDELVEEIRAHIAEARTAGPASGPGAAADVRNILDRLGKPEDIARAAGAGQPGGSHAAGAEMPAGQSPPPASGAGPLEISTIVLLLIGGLLAGIGWIVGVILLWLSPRWSRSDKLLGTLVWPGGLGIGVAASSTMCTSGNSSARATVSGPIGQVSVNSPAGRVNAGLADHRDASTTETCVTNGPNIPVWLLLVIAVAALLITIGGPILVAIRLLRRASRLPADAPPDPAMMQHA